MRLIRSSHHACDLARESISLRLDGELPELDAARLDAHLETCADCREFAAETLATSGLLRAAAPVEPDFEIVLPRKRLLSVRSLQAGVAAAAVAAVVGLSMVGGVTQREAASGGVAATIGVSHDDELAPDRSPAPHAHFRTAI